MAAITSKNQGVKPGSIRDNVTTPYVEQPDHKTIVLDTKYTPTHNLLVHVEGFQWKVTYYSQLLGLESSTAGQNVTKSVAYQRYTRIIDLLVKVTSPISVNQESDTKSMNASGEMLLPPGLIPNAGDMFIADRGDGILGIYEVRESTKKSIFKESAYSVSFNAVDESIEASDKRILDLDAKTSSKKVFSMDFLENNQDPYVDEEVVQVIRELNINRTEMLSRYFRRFYSDEFNVMLMPNQEHMAVYEHFLTKHVSKCYNELTHSRLTTMRVLNVSARPEMDFPSLWDALETRDRFILEDCFKAALCAPTTVYSAVPTLSSVRYSGCSHLVYPKSEQYSVDSEQFGEINPAERMGVYQGPSGWGMPATYTTIRPTVSAGFKMSITPQKFKAFKDRPLINQIFPEEAYVLSKDFYSNNHDGMSHLEILVKQYMSDDYIDVEVLKHLMDDCMNWGRLEQFYYIPILSILSKYSIRSF